ncbi:uncharacterized protein NECHADRAFT_85629 [Fusarium vanettenii 77-13-4]|uniref:Uncharacterized protein n=1 Tax=Fusarium vanettenii (strain ATCC MYA-4622 / CBS 123669 / FGSC 9596 / NRRL 45880 / 77-13-4) TaxID=660122 RepID=C7ZP83_FUSV7|nr:uncharacterized protein NECHADRAFT_85629 [Fusarium vanettenii 77-13-4]EEU34302.1 hypothetical protein NECHADRAFT_85629 [Fusarium vanettenii 77-13-4]
MVVTTPTYHIISRVPPPPQGPLKLGTVIDSLEELIPLSDSLDVEGSRVTQFREEDFEVNRAQILKGAGGVGFKVLGMPVGIDISGGGDTAVNDTYKFKELDTVSFNPTPDDYQKAVAASQLQDYLEDSGYTPVYIVTGMKIGHRPEVTLRRGNQVNGTFTIGISDGNATLGTNANASSSSNIVQGSKSSPDSIVFAIRVRKLSFTKRYYIWGPRKLRNDPYNCSAELVGVGREADKSSEPAIFDVKEMDLDEEILGRATQERGNSQEGRFILVL